MSSGKLPRACTQCGKEFYSAIQRRGRGTFCSDKCRSRWHDNRERLHLWLLIQLVQQLWPHRSADFVFQPEPFETGRFHAERLACWNWLEEVANGADYFGCER
jgi:endogenous inhibitor of DNA gyrase (YacG/DUF329 family)